MAATIDEITIHYEENGEVLVKELKKEVLSRGAWTTILFLYEEFDRRKKTFGAPKVAIRRYRKRNGQYQQQSKFTISSPEQGRKVARLLLEWFPE
ncbi:MAG: hypothetical protein D6812_03105 [Deltaproteobacteria bacterium]|nr:MAG: hypothetical protein D6812_03105 [Deltaproteobacteria bacterium]